MGIRRVNVRLRLDVRTRAYLIAAAISTASSWWNWSHSNVRGTWISVTCLVLIQICASVDIVTQILRTSVNADIDERLLFTGAVLAASSLAMSYFTVFTNPPGDAGGGGVGCEYYLSDHGIISCITRERFERGEATLPMLLLLATTMFIAVPVWITLSWRGSTRRS